MDPRASWIPEIQIVFAATGRDTNNAPAINIQRRGSNETACTTDDEDQDNEGQDNVGDCQLIAEDHGSDKDKDDADTTANNLYVDHVTAARRFLSTTASKISTAARAAAAAEVPQIHAELPLPHQMAPLPAIVWRGRRCAHCGLRTLGLCLGCFLVPYCDLNCSTQQWYQGHYLACPMIASHLCQMIQMAVQAMLAQDNRNSMVQNDNDSTTTTTVNPTTVATRTIRLMNAVNGTNLNDTDDENNANSNSTPPTTTTTTIIAMTRATRILNVAVAVAIAQIMDEMAGMTK